jgi:hypothetical protein
MPQTSILQIFPTAVAGMLDGNGPHSFDTCYLTEDGPVAGASAAGLFVEYDPNVTTGKGVRFPQTTSAGGVLAGVLMYDPTNEPAVASPGNLGGPWKKGQPVQVLRKGRIWAVKGGTANPSINVAPNVMHSSTIATDRGKITGDATSSTAGSEIQAAGAGVVSKSRRDLTLTPILQVVELNLPG